LYNLQYNEDGDKMLRQLLDAENWIYDGKVYGNS